MTFHNPSGSGRVVPMPDGRRESDTAEFLRLMKERERITRRLEVLAEILEPGCIAAFIAPPGLPQPATFVLLKGGRHEA